jgi:iron complex outermembrane recepter protein
MLFVHRLRPTCALWVGLAACSALSAPTVLRAQALPPSPVEEDAPADAAPPDAPQPGADLTQFTLGRIQIQGRAQGPVPARQLLTSVDVISADTLSDETAVNTWELFQRVPGMQLTAFNQGTTSGKVSFRGFNGEGNVNAVKLLIDGIPSNSNDGNMPYLDLVTTGDLDHITTVRGTNDARYGLYNIAGNIDLTTRVGGEGQDLRLATGSHGLADLQWNAAHELGGLSQNYSVEAKHSDGWRDHATNDQVTLAGKWFWQPDDGRWRAGVIWRHHQQKAQEPGYLTDSDATSHPTESYALSSTDGGWRHLGQLSLHLDGAITPTLSGQFKAYINTFNDQRWVRFSESSSQQERDTEERHVGWRSLLSWRPQQAALPGLTLEAGLDGEKQRNDSERYLTTERARTSQSRDQHFTLNSVGGFVQAVVQPISSLQLVPAWRVDHLSGAFENRLTSVQAPLYDYGLISQPKISAVWTPVEAQSLYANWGRTFQVGIGSAAYKVPPLTNELKPSINTGWETGWKFHLAGHTQGRLALWQQIATNEVNRKLNDPNGDSENVGSTRRRGVDLELRTAFSPTLQGWTSLTWQKAVILTPPPEEADTQGRELDHVPHHLYTAGVDWQWRPTLRLSTWLEGQSDYFLENTNSTGHYGGYTTFNLSLAWQQNDRWTWTLAVRNLTNTRAEYVWWDDTQRLHAPGDGLNVQAAVQVHL